MQRFNEFLEAKRSGSLRNVQFLLEIRTYKDIPGTVSSYREDPPNTNTLTQRHVHVYAKREGKGKELYSVNLDGSGHDGNSGTSIPKSHADFFREKGYEIPNSNILECISYESQLLEYYVILVEYASDA